MRKKVFFATVVGGSAVAGGIIARQYRQDLGAARARLAAVRRVAIQTESGAVEYAEHGEGEPVLAVHGIFGGCDAGLLSVGDLFPDSRVIAPSRFGYLGSSLPPAATPADQADAYARLLDVLGIERADLIAFSAGTTSAVQFALRHPDRVKHLVVMAGSWPGSRTASRQSPANRWLVRSDFPLWALRTFAWPTMIRLVGVPGNFRLTAADGHFVDQVVDSIFPVVPRGEGVMFDFLVSNAEVNNLDLAAIRVPTMIVHAKDDPLASYDPALQASARIPGARLVTVDRGGHLLLGQQEKIAPQLADFLEKPTPAEARAALGTGLGAI